MYMCVNISIIVFSAKKQYFNFVTVIWNNISFNSPCKVTVNGSDLSCVYLQALYMLPSLHHNVRFTVVRLELWQSDPSDFYNYQVEYCGVWKKFIPEIGHR